MPRIPKQTDPYLEELFFKLGYDILPDGDVIDKRGDILNLYKIDGVYKFTPIINRRKYMFVVHRLQAFKKFGTALFKEDIVVIHDDLNNFNNKFENIKLGTRSDRMMRRPEAERLAHSLLAASHNKLFDDNAVYAEYLETNSYKKTMTKFGIVSKSTLHGIIKKHSRKVEEPKT